MIASRFAVMNSDTRKVVVGDRILACCVVHGMSKRDTEAATDLF